MAIEHANRVITWQENLLEDEMPPSWMWHLDTELEAWFDDVAAKRKERYGGGGGDDDRDVDGPAMDNEFARGRR